MEEHLASMKPGVQTPVLPKKGFFIKFCILLFLFSCKKHTLEKSLKKSKAAYLHNGKA
jgi:hypothetical protein